MAKPEIDEFARILIQEVRDAAIRSLDGQLSPSSRSPVAKRWRKAAADANGQVPPEVVIPDVVDETLFYLLRAIDNGELPLKFVGTRGKIVDLEEDGMGEMAGEYVGPEGWRQMSKERYADD
jgi:hypothetical protein